MVTGVKSYLSCRKQFVQNNGYNSSSLDITCGVPQGCILGPLLFYLFLLFFSIDLVKAAILFLVSFWMNI